MIRDCFRILWQGVVAYALLLLPYSLVNDAHSAMCGTKTTVWAFATSGTNTRTSYSVPVLTTTTNPTGCALVVLTGAEYGTLISNDSTLNTNINNVQTLANNAQNIADNALNTANSHTTAINTLSSNDTTLQNNITAVEGIANNALSTANQALNASPLNNVSNILNISAQDAQQLMYAVLALFAVAYAGRAWRKAVSSTPTYEGD